MGLAWTRLLGGEKLEEKFSERSELRRDWGIGEEKGHDREGPKNHRRVAFSPIFVS